MNSYLTSFGPALANHLWQSTAFGVLAWLLTLALRRNQARVRYAVWLTASIKFLLPFSLLVLVGHLLPQPKQPLAPVVYSAMNVVEEPFAIDAAPIVAAPVHVPTVRERVAAVAPVALGTLWLIGFGAVLLAWGNRWRVLARSLRHAVPAAEGRELEVLRRLGGKGLPLLMSAERMEPGVFGIVRPVLVWPAQLSAQLDDHHIEAIVAHELTHVRRRDNLTASLHMLVEAAFWFHPLVWWIERQMVKEREQACDETVVAMGGCAETYAESLLKTCWFCIESPLPCVSGVTGADLKRRVADIITGRTLSRMTWPKKVMLAAAAVSTLFAPLLLGQAKAAQKLVLSAIHVTPEPLSPTEPTINIQPVEGTPAPTTCVVPPADTIDVATIKPSQSDPSSTHLSGKADGLSATSNVFHMIGNAYDLRDFQVSGGPSWVTTAAWDVAAKVVEPPANYNSLSNYARGNLQHHRMQAILTQRFALRCHFETKELPVYNLVLAKGGSKLKPTPKDAAKKGAIDGDRVGSQEHVEFAGVEVSDLVRSLSSYVGRTVIDKTGVAGLHDFTLDWVPDHNASTGSDAQSSGPTIFTALQEQLGLKLESSKGPVRVLVIDRIDKPTLDGAGVEANPQTSSTGTVTSASEVANAQLQAVTDIPEDGFEVVTIKPSSATTRGAAWGMSPDSNIYYYRNAEIALVIGTAYFPETSMLSSRVSGGPDWMTSDRFDIVAKFDAPTFEALKKLPLGERDLRAKAMLRKMLVERFHLAVHTVPATVKGGVLLVAEGGPKMNPVPAADSPLPKEVEDSVAQHSSKWVNLTTGGRFTHPARDESVAPHFYEMTMDQFARQLSQPSFPVANKTGLSGVYQFFIDPPDPSDYITKDEAGHLVSIDVQSMITKWGFKKIGLVLKQAPIESSNLVIDHLERPTAN